MYVDVKETIWVRYFLDGKQEEILKSVNDENWFMRFERGSNTLYDGETEVIKVEDNGGHATMELYNEDGELIWDNIKTE